MKPAVSYRKAIIDGVVIAFGRRLQKGDEVVIIVSEEKACFS